MILHKLSYVFANKFFRTKKRYLIVILSLIVFKILFNTIKIKIHNHSNTEENSKLKIYFQNLNDSFVSSHSYLVDYKYKREQLINELSIRSQIYSKFRVKNKRKNIKKQAYLVLEYTKFFYDTKYCHLFQDNLNETWAFLFNKR